MSEELNQLRDKFTYRYEELNNGIVLRDEANLNYAAALFSNSQEENEEVYKLLGKFLYDDLKQFCNDMMTCKVQIHITLEDETLKNEE